MIDLKAWLSLHPYAASLISWLVMSLLLWAFRPRTPTEYDKLPPRLAAFLQLLRGLFGDGAKIVEAARKLFVGVSVPEYKVGPAQLEYLTERLNERFGLAPKDRTDERGAASVGALAGLALAMVGIFCVWLSACTPHAGAATLSAAQRIEKQRVDYRAAVLECASRHATNCQAFDVCQKTEALKRNLQLVKTTCTEVTPAEAHDAGLLDGARQ